MEPLFHAASLVSSAAASSLISAIWEGTVLAAGVLVCLRFTPRLSAASRSLVWMNLFFLLVLLHFMPAFYGKPAASSPIEPARIGLDQRWSLAIAGLWALLSIWKAAQLMVSAVRVHRLAARATPVAPDAALQPLLAIGPRRRAVELCTSNEIIRPSVLGFLRPRILLPPALTDRLTPLELRQVVLHEMEHLRRADDWTNLLQKVALVLFPLNPVLLWVERRVCAERELACDDRVLLKSGAGKAYAVCLTRLAEYSALRRSLSLALGAWERRPELVRRVHRLLRRPHAAMSSLQAGMATAALMAAVLGGALALARSPQLVGFAAPKASAAAFANSPVSALHSAVAVPASLRAMSASRQRAPQMIEARAVIPESPAQPRPLAKPPLKRPAPRRDTMLAQASMGRGPINQNSINQDSIDQDLVNQDSIEQTWMVLTEWSDIAPPPRPVLLKLDVRGSYAAVPVAGGWLIVRI